MRYSKLLTITNLTLFLFFFQYIHCIEHNVNNKNNIISYAKCIITGNQLVRIKHGKYQKDHYHEKFQNNNTEVFERVVDIARDVYVCTVSSSNLHERRNAFMRILDTIKNGILSFVCNDNACHCCK